MQGAWVERWRFHQCASRGHGRQGLDGGTALLGQPSQPSAPCLTVARATTVQGRLGLHLRPPQAPTSQDDARSCSYPLSPYAQRESAALDTFLFLRQTHGAKWVYPCHFRGQKVVGYGYHFPSLLCMFGSSLCHSPVESYFTGEEMMLTLRNTRKERKKKKSGDKI